MDITLPPLRDYLRVPERSSHLVDQEMPVRDPVFVGLLAHKVADAVRVTQAIQQAREMGSGIRVGITPDRQRNPSDCARSRAERERDEPRTL